MPKKTFLLFFSHLYCPEVSANRWVNCQPSGGFKTRLTHLLVYDVSCRRTCRHSCGICIVSRRYCLNPFVIRMPPPSLSLCVHGYNGWHVFFFRCFSSISLPLHFFLFLCVSLCFCVSVSVSVALSLSLSSFYHLLTDRTCGPSDQTFTWNKNHYFCSAFL